MTVGVNIFERLLGDKHLKLKANLLVLFHWRFGQVLSKAVPEATLPLNGVSMKLSWTCVLGFVFSLGKYLTHWQIFNSEDHVGPWLSTIYCWKYLGLVLYGFNPSYSFCTQCSHFRFSNSKHGEPCIQYWKSSPTGFTMSRLNTIEWKITLFPFLEYTNFRPTIAWACWLNCTSLPLTMCSTIMLSCT